jgi:hypothetical protein
MIVKKKKNVVSYAVEQRSFILRQFNGYTVRYNCSLVSALNFDVKLKTYRSVVYHYNVFATVMHCGTNVIILRRRNNVPRNAVNRFRGGRFASVIRFKNRNV